MNILEILRFRIQSLNDLSMNAQTTLTAYTLLIRRWAFYAKFFWESSVTMKASLHLSDLCASVSIHYWH